MRPNRASIFFSTWLRNASSDRPVLIRAAALRKLGPVDPTGGVSQIDEVLTSSTSSRNSSSALGRFISGEMLEPSPR